MENDKLINDLRRMSEMNSLSLWKRDVCKRAADALSIPAVDAVEVPQTGIGDLSDGYHTFNGLYHQRLILFAALVKAYKDRAWKSYRHEDGELCFGGGWFIVGIDTPEGSYTYHYENKDFDLFDCEELPVGKHWDGHTEDDVTRLLSLAVDAVEEKQGFWKVAGTGHPKQGNQRYRKQDQWTVYKCSNCGASNGRNRSDPYCRHCGARMLVDNCRYCYNPVEGWTATKTRLNVTTRYVESYIVHECPLFEEG